MHFLLFITALYFAPAIVAAARHTHNATAILLLNLFLGWTVIGWFAAHLLRGHVSRRAQHHPRLG